MASGQVKQCTAIEGALDKEGVGVLCLVEWLLMFKSNLTFAHKWKLKPSSALHLPNYLIHTVVCTHVLV